LSGAICSTIPERIPEFTLGKIACLGGAGKIGRLAILSRKQQFSRMVRGQAIAVWDSEITLDFLVLNAIERNQERYNSFPVY
jgi:hypothetical protein